MTNQPRIKIMKNICFFTAVLAMALSTSALARDCSDYLGWDLQARIKSIDNRIGYYRFNPSYYTNVPNSWLTIEYDVKKLCLKNDYKYKSLDDVYDEASLKNGMKKL